MSELAALSAVMTRVGDRERMGGCTNLGEGALGEDAAARSVRGQFGEFEGGVDSHEQAGLPASTVTDNDQLATDFRHLRDCVDTLCRGRRERR